VFSIPAEATPNNLPGETESQRADKFLAGNPAQIGQNERMIGQLLFR
jgi:hypothetical protein